MLPPLKMVATKKPVLAGRALGLTAAVVLLFDGCTPPGPRALLKGERLVREHRFDAAIVQLEAATRLLPEEARAWNHLGLAYHGAGRPADATRAYQQALSLNHNLAAAQYNLGCLHLERGELSAAVAALTTYTGLQPQAEVGWLKLGTASLRAGQLDAAERHFNRALQINARSAEALNGLGLVRVQRRRYAEAGRQFDAALNAQADFAPALLNSAVVAHQFLNDRAEALKKYRLYAALTPRPADAEAVERLARQLDAELHPPPRQPVTAESAAPVRTTPTPAGPETTVVKRETRTEPRPPGARPATAPPPVTAPNRPASSDAPSVAASAGPTRPKPATAEPKTEEGATSARQSGLATRTQPPTKTAVVPPPAASETGEASRLQRPTSPTTSNTALAVRAPLSARASPVGYPYQSPSAPKPGDRAAAERSVGEGLRLQERYQVKQAIEKYREALRADPSCFDAYYNLGVAAFDSGDLPQTLTAYEYALAVDPASRKARFNFALALERSGYHRDAAQELERLLASHPTEVRAQFNLARLCAERLGDPQRAKAAYLRVLELDPQHPQATAIRYWLEANP